MAVNNEVFAQIHPNTPTANKDALINENFRKLSDAFSPLVINDGENDRVVIGKHTDGTYKIAVSRKGADVFSAEPSELIMSSDFNMYKIIKEGYIEPVPRAGTVTLAGDYIGYLLVLNIEIGKTGEDFPPYPGEFSSRIMTNVCRDKDKSPITGGGLYWWDGNNRAFYSNSFRLIPNTNKLSIQFGIRCVEGSVTINPRNLFSERLYWQISNPTRDAIYWGGSGGLGQGKYIYQDIIVYNEDGTVKEPLQSSTRELNAGDPAWQTFPYSGTPWW